MDLTAATRSLSSAVSAAARLLSARSGLLLRAGRDGLTVGGNDSERAVRLTCDAVVHTDGEVLVPAGPLAETLRMLEDDLVRLVVEGSRLAVRVEGGRFALPLLSRELRLQEMPPKVSEVDGAALATALRTVAGTAAKDDALPMFTGVRVQSFSRELRLTASDRYRMAVATLPLRAEGEPIDALVPAGLLAETAKQARGTVGLHGDGTRFGLSWAGVTVTTAVLDAGFLSEKLIESSTVDTTVEVSADALAAAVRRVGVYADERRVLTLEVGDSQLRLASSKQDTGEAEETLKAEVSGGRTSPSFQARYLLDALQGFAGERVRLDIQPGMRACVIRAVEPGDVELTYYVMPMLPR
ncbi:DNA polymerase III subunit beta [Amycolatopsis azurea]|uniref:DNA polymerase III beta subunit n=1 Tax=Amycolatopsis azurea DSM 43854 TaxID=1238180 RepID=M2Q721_9PSEU|nr:DNA polymerase III subunit beta [Amycolatopsis azurea]EMD22526.1 DNA polymerase III beta subunit [Amycolatopsis azurea DSM 43854]OOC08369.1 DNA polymerase III subunit beta [Amycolatopsis azurea DSM 43854]